MASRWLEQKRLKQKRMRRAWAKPYSMKGRVIDKNAGFLNDQNRYVPNSLGSRNHSANSTPWITAAIWKLLQKNPDYLSDEATFVYARSGGIHADLAPNITLFRAVRSGTDKTRINQAGTLQGEEPLVYSKINDPSFVELRLYMGRTDCFFLGHKIENNKNVLVGTISYGDRHRALKKHRDHELTWVHRSEEDISPDRADP